MFEGFWMVVYKEKSSLLVRLLVKKEAELDIMRYRETEIIDTFNIATDKRGCL